ncbi:MAG: DUF1217 domain-containing protein [Hyphomicrobiales bacterium]|nr:DUF1217 domain-containing protein [Hyphomicrobiales bacterium]
MLSTAASYKLLTQNIDKSLARVRAAPDVNRETDHYLATIGKIKTIEDFLANDRVFAYAMKAFGLKDMIYAKAFVKKVLADGIDSANSFTNQLTDPRFKELATAFNFKSLGTTTTIFERTQKGVVDRFLQVQLEEQAGSSNEGVRLALYFRRKAPDITSAYSILGDSALYKVAQVALGLTASSNASNLDMQAKIIENKIDLENLDDPAVLNKFLTRFTTLWEVQNGTAAATAPALAIIQGVQSITSMETLTKIQSLRFKGFS